MSKLGIVGATALSLALAVATRLRRELRGGGAMHVGSGGFRGDRAIVGPVISSADASYCAQRWAYYDGVREVHGRRWSVASCR